MAAQAPSLQPLTVTVAELADLARVHPRTIFRHRRQGLIQFVYIGRSPRIRIEEARRYLEGVARDDRP